jgi:hypothetical protein
MIEFDKAYRYEDWRYAAPVDEYEKVIGSGRTEVKLYIFPIIKHTPK